MADGVEDGDLVTQHGPIPVSAFPLQHIIRPSPIQTL